MTARLSRTLSFSDFAGKTWMARLKSRDPKYSYTREFISGKRDSSKSGRTGTFTYMLEPGLYEECERGERSYRLVWVRDVAGTRQDGTEIPIGAVSFTTIDGERVEAILSLMEKGKDFETARKETKPVK